MTYPIKITEIPHRGSRHTWILRDERHLAQCISHAIGFDSWAEREGLTDDEAGTPAAYLSFLADDLQRLIIEETP
jgi:hypothetical protein